MTQRLSEEQFAKRLDAVLQGEIRTQETLGQLPEQAEEFAALFALADRLKHAPPVEPSMHLRHATRARVLSKLADFQQPAPSLVERVAGGFKHLLPRLAPAAVALALVVAAAAYFLGSPAGPSATPAFQANQGLPAETEAVAVVVPEEPSKETNATEAVAVVVPEEPGQETAAVPDATQPTPMIVAQTNAVLQARIVDQMNAATSYLATQIAQAESGSQPDMDVVVSNYGNMLSEVAGTIESLDDTGENAVLASTFDQSLALQGAQINTLFTLSDDGGGVPAASCNDEITHPVIQKLVDDYEEDAAEIKGLICNPDEKLGFGEVMLVIIIHQKLKSDDTLDDMEFDDIVTAHLTHKGWGNVFKALGLKGKDHQPDHTGKPDEPGKPDKTDNENKPVTPADDKEKPVTPADDKEKDNNAVVPEKPDTPSNDKDDKEVKEDKEDKVKDDKND